MKKLTIVLAAIAFAFGVQAAEYSWKIQNVMQYGTTDTKITKTNAGSAYLIMCMYSADTTISATMANSTFSAGDDKIIGSFAVGGTGGTSSLGSKLASEDYANGSYYYVVLYNSKGAASTTAFDNYGVGAVLTGDPTLVSPSVPLALQWTTTNQGNMNVYSPSSAAPEPTSGLLLLLGMAGLALKRKRT